MNDTTPMAVGTMDVAQKRLLHDFPFHARFVATWKVEPTGTVATAGVTVRDGVILLLYAPEFVLRCTLEELESVLVHEVNHVLFEHVLAAPANDEYARMLAEEVTVNEWVSGPLPGNPITLSQFPDLPRNEDTITRYNKLARPGRPTPPDMVDCAPKNAGGVPNGTSSVPKNAPPVPKNGRSVPKNGPPVPEKKLQPLDDHSLWAQAREAEQLSRMVVRVSVAEARGALTPNEWAKVQPIFRNQIDKLGCGNMPGAQTENLIAGKTRVSWKHVLQAYVRQAVSLEPAFQRPPRRFPSLVGIVPGKMHRAKAKVMGVIDTSGSIDTLALAQISAELKRMSQSHEVMVVECDAAIQAIYPFSRAITMVTGRGGTDLRPPFQSDVLRKIHPDVVVYFTDGDGPAPLHPPRVPIVWCLTPDGSPPAPWGRVIMMA